MFSSPLKSHDNAPKFHEDRLIVKITPSVAGGGMAVLSAGTGRLSSPGMSILDRMDRSGVILKVTNLDATPHRPRTARSRAAVAELLGMSPQGTNESATGMRMIQVTKGTDLGQLQAALAEDASIELVSQVPVRYLMGKKKAAGRQSPARSPAAGTRTTSKTARKGIRAGTKTGRVRIAAVPPAPVTMWNLQKIKWQEAQTLGFNDAANVRVSVLDTGIDLGHPDLPGDQIDYIHDYGDDVEASDRDIIGHGTHVSGTIRALTNGNIGINGICNCQLAVYKIFDDEADFSGRDRGWEVYEYFVDPEMYHSALIRCASDGTRVVNLSIGGYGQPSQAEQLLFEDLRNAGVCVVAAMGNDNTRRKSFPAAIPGVIAVGASRINDARASFSNFGPHISLVAPGEDIWSTLPTYPGDFGHRKNPTTGQIVKDLRETDYDAWPGTSMATPHVAAAAALLLGKDNSLSPGDIKRLLEENCDQVPGMNGNAFTEQFGHGRLNLEKLAGAV